MAQVWECPEKKKWEIELLWNTELSFVFASNSIWATLQIWFCTWHPSVLIMAEWCLNSLCLSVNLRWGIYRVAWNFCETSILRIGDFRTLVGTNWLKLMFGRTSQSSKTGGKMWHPRSLRKWYPFGWPFRASLTWPSNCFEFVSCASKTVKLLT